MKTILIIEDDPRITDALSIRLKAADYRPLVAHDAVSGTRIAVQNKPDLMLLDLALPGGNGWDIAKQFSTLPQTRDIPIVLLTASKDPHLRKKAMEMHLAGLFEKPYDAEELLSVVEFALNKWQPPRASSKFPGLRPAAECKILIIEDDAKIAEALELRMKGAGYQTLIAHDAASGMDAVMREQPDVVLLDISMPAGDGFEIAKRVNAQMRRRPPIIFLTASKRPELRKTARELGATAFFEKPYEASQLLSAVRIALHEPIVDA
jgi:DNA-binding response OmpR family regulator